MFARPPPANRGMVRGEVYDDSKGLPLAGADVMLLGDSGAPLANPIVLNADERGQFAIPAKPGDAIVRISKIGFTTVERTVTVPASTAITMVDARLTPLDARANSVAPALNEVARNAAGRVTLALPAGSLDQRSVNPESIAAGFITAHHRRRDWHRESGAAVRNRPLDRRPIPTRHRAHPRRDTESRRHRQLPVFVPQFECHE